MFTIVAGNLISLCSLMIVGFAAGKIGAFGKDGEAAGAAGAAFGNLLLNVALPCTIIMSMQKPFTAELFSGGILTLAVSMAVYSASLAAGWLLCKVLRVTDGRRKIFLFAAAFPNVGYMGFPVIGAVYGEAALFYVSMNNIAFNVLSSTVGISIMKGKTKGGKRRLSWRDVPLLPTVTLVGFSLFVTGVMLPKPLANALTMGSNMTTPLSMIIIGGILSRSDLTLLFKGWRDYCLAAFRLLAWPTAVFLVLSPFIADKTILGIVTLLAGMPAAAVTAIYADRFTEHGVYGSKVVAMTTIASLLSLPVVALLL